PTAIPYNAIFHLLSVITFGLASSTPSHALHPRDLHNCTTCAPNIISEIYPNNVTATINATSFILTVPITYARSLLPSSLAPLILTNAYTRFSIPKTHYPIVLDGAFQHDIRYKGINAVPDQPSLRLTFPFIDLLKDNGTCFRYTSYIYLAQSPVALNGTASYGIGTIFASFDPDNEPYTATNPSGHLAFSVYAEKESSPEIPHRPEPDATATFSPASPIDANHAFPLAFYRNITNQPTFGNNTALCDQKIRMWNTSLSEGAEERQHVIADVVLGTPLLEAKRVWRGVKGIRASQAVVENLYLECGSLKGYRGTGEGDSG
ncbi:MAG: hypothetical protein Q9200_005057, partial [Gallowayella weberi]